MHAHTDYATQFEQRRAVPTGVLALACPATNGACMLGDIKHQMGDTLPTRWNAELWAGEGNGGKGVCEREGRLVGCWGLGVVEVASESKSEAVVLHIYA
jgi:hypothetical protein